MRSILEFDDSCDKMSIAESSSRKLFIAVSLIALLRMYFCRFVVFFEIPRLTTHKSLSERLLSTMEGEMAMCFMWSFAEYLIDEDKQIPGKSGRKDFVGNDIIHAQQVEEFIHFITIRKP